MLEPVQLKSNEFWGKRFGNYSDIKPKNCNLPWGNHFPKVGYGSQSSNSAKSINKPDTAMAKAMRKQYQDDKELYGPPVIYIGSNNRRDRAKDKTQPHRRSN